MPVADVPLSNSFTINSHRPPVRHSVKRLAGGLNQLVAGLTVLVGNQAKAATVLGVFRPVKALVMIVTFHDPEF